MTDSPDERTRRNYLERRDSAVHESPELCANYQVFLEAAAAMQIIIYPAFDAFYYSFYIQGLLDLFGESRVKFSYREFPFLESNLLAFVVKGDQNLRVVIDAYDGARIVSSAAVEWCDVYGKVNLVSSILTKKDAHKFLAIGPSFPIQVWSAAKSWWLALQNYSPRSGEYSSVKEHFANYRRQYKYRLPLKYFVPGYTKNDYVFYASSIWNEDEAPNANHHRALFMKQCKLLKGITFEGGFAPTRSPVHAERYQSYITRRRFSLPEWLEKIQLSAVAFYTPGVWLSHTFKLAEFLALGKAIICTSISRELPAPLVHGEQVHDVDGSAESIRDAINCILEDQAYRMHLEQNAYNYYSTFLSPMRVIRRLLEYGNKNNGLKAFRLEKSLDHHGMSSS